MKKGRMLKIELKRRRDNWKSKHLHSFDKDFLPLCNLIALRKISGSTPGSELRVREGQVTQTTT